MRTEVIVWVGFDRYCRGFGLSMTEDRSDEAAELLLWTADCWLP